MRASEAAVPADLATEGGGWCAATARRCAIRPVAAPGRSALTAMAQLMGSQTVHLHLALPPLVVSSSHLARLGFRLSI